MSKVDGGQTALAGYLYQIVGALGMMARADCPNEEEELQALLTLVREGELLHEYLDQDAVLRTLGIDGRDECVFVQFKFSRQATPPTIGPQELIEIVKQLILSERKAKQLDQVVTGYALITNREIGAQSEKIIELMSDWSNLPTNHARRSESIERALRRLQIANPNEFPPILYLGIDGLDENIIHPEQERRVRDILRWFWQEDKRARHANRPPRATLVVTCRKKEDVTRWLQLEQSAFRYRGELPVTIEVDDFSEKELLRAAEKGLPQFLAQFQASIQVTTPQPEEFMRSMFDTSFFAPLATVGMPTREQEPLIDSQVLSSLRHPAMWRALLELEPQIQREVLDGKLSALHQLAHVFVLWFSKKAIIRGASDLEEYDILWILKEIACYTKNNVKMIQTNNEWIDPACASQMMNHQEARQLQREALLAGLIERDDRRHWRWRHQLVVDYLVVAELNGE